MTPTESNVKEVGFVDLIQEILILLGKAGW